MREYEFSLTRFLPYKDKIYDFLLIRENTGQWKPVFSHILRSEGPERWIIEVRFMYLLISLLIHDQLTILVGVKKGQLGHL